MKKKIFLPFLFIAFTASCFLFSCKKDDSTADPKGTINLGITDTRSSHQKSGNDIIDEEKLTKFEISISQIEITNSNDEKISLLDQEVAVDLRNFKGTLKDLGSVKVPLGSYKGIKIYLSGVVISYDGNTYTSSVSGTTSLSLADLPGVTLTAAQGIPNSFASETILELQFEFDLSEKLSTRSIRISMDAVASCFEIEYSCTPCTEPLQYFVGLRSFFQMGVIFEEGIQQIKHSPPLGINASSGLAVDYYGIHTFIDFNGFGGTINSHTSQHVYRGEDGSLSVDAEDMAVNSTALKPTTIEATGETDVTADETFHFTEIGATLSSKQHTLESGKTYYFSLRKTWNITSKDQTYEITRICEPMPVLWP